MRFPGYPQQIPRAGAAGDKAGKNRAIAPRESVILKTKSVS